MTTRGTVTVYEWIRADGVLRETLDKLDRWLPECVAFAGHDTRTDAAAAGLAAVRERMAQLVALLDTERSRVLELEALQNQLERDRWRRPADRSVAVHLQQVRSELGERLDRLAHADGALRRTVEDQTARLVDLEPGQRPSTGVGRNAALSQVHAHTEADNPIGVDPPNAATVEVDAWVGDRVADSRRRLRAALVQLRDLDRDLDRELDTRAAGRRHEPAGRPLSRARAWAHAAWLGRDALAGWIATGAVGAQDSLHEVPALLRAEIRTRARLYEMLLNRREGGRRRQVLEFDESGRGRCIELHGSLATARHLAVVVPGTGTAMRGFHMPAEFAAALVAADPSGGTAAIAWMGADFPQAFANQAPLAGYAERAAPALVGFLDRLPVPPACEVTLIGHSYGGVIVGAAERLGVRCDRVIHVASAGAGPHVGGVGDYAEHDTHGQSRHVRRFTLTAPGDPIRLAQRLTPPSISETARLPEAVTQRLARWLGALDLGIDPARLVGVTVLQSGLWSDAAGADRAGTPVAGRQAHAAVVDPATESFTAISAAVRGEHGTPDEPA